MDIVRVMPSSNVVIFPPSDANVNAVCGGRNTPLHSACESSNIDTVKLLVERGAKIDSRNSEQSTPLHKACRTNRHRVVEYLLTK